MFLIVSICFYLLYAFLFITFATIFVTKRFIHLHASFVKNVHWVMVDEKVALDTKLLGLECMRSKTFMILAVVIIAVFAMSGCKKETYTVTFLPNGGNGVMTPQTFTEGKSQALDINAFTRDGYSFSGWNTTPAGIGDSYADGQTITVTADMILYAMWQAGGGSGSGSGGGASGPTQGQLNGYDWVDLGLPSGTKWATCNVGAETPEDFGGYYAWGETYLKDGFTWSNYTYCHGDLSTLTKYCNNPEYGYNGFTDNLTTLQSSDDVATAICGAGWRMPTETEMLELNEKCTVTWTTQNGVNGNLFTGPNGRSIFMPAAGYYEESYNSGYGSYWSSSLYTSYPFSARYLNFSSSYCTVNGYVRFAGRSVRPVC